MIDEVKLHNALCYAELLPPELCVHYDAAPPLHRRHIELALEDLGVDVRTQKSFAELTVEYNDLELEMERLRLVLEERTDQCWRLSKELEGAKQVAPAPAAVLP